MKDSSFIREVVWSEGNLYVRLKSGKFYQYENVPYEVYEDFIDADSLGKFFGDHIKDQYEYIAFEEVEEKKTKGGTANLPKAWNFPKATDFAAPVDHGSDVVAAWPFPTGNKP
jgi:hypothetical protein